MRDLLEKSLTGLGIETTKQLLNQFEIYQSVLIDWNQKINLTAITEPDQIAIKHFADSATVLLSGKISGKIIDVGTGAGFPGLVLKLVAPQIELTLLDSLNKRIHFLEAASKEMGLTGITFLHGRAEDAGKDKTLRESFDTAVARAVAPLRVLCEYSLPFVKTGGYFIAMKGADCAEEIEKSKNALQILGGNVEEIRSVEIPCSEITHSLIVIRKVRQSPTQYPRKAGKPSKEPL